MHFLFNCKKIVIVFLLVLFNSLVTLLNAQTVFNQSNNGVWDGYTALMPYESVSTFAPIPGACGFEASQFFLFEENRSSTGATNGFNSSKYNTTSLESAVSENNYIWFDIAASVDTVFIDSIVLYLRKSNTGPVNTNLSYATSTLGSASYTSLTSVTGLAAGSAVEFALVSEVPIVILPGQTFRFRLTSWGASNVTGTIRIKNASYLSGYSVAPNLGSDTARFYNLASTIDTFAFCLGEVFDFEIQSNGIGDTVFYRIINGGSVSHHQDVVPSSGIIHLSHIASTVGAYLYIIDSSKTTNHCIATLKYSDSLYMVNSSHITTNIDTSVQLCFDDTMYWNEHIIIGSGVFSDYYMSDKGCDSIVNLIVDFEKVYAASTDGFDFIQSIISNPLEVQFAPINPYSVSNYLWDFGDGNTSSVSHPLHTYAAFGSYIVTLIVDNICGTTVDSLHIFVQPNTSSVDAHLNNAKVSVYPNPTKDCILFENPMQLPFTSLKLVDMTGKLVLEHSFLNKSLEKIECSHLAAGVYAIIICNLENQFYYDKLVIQ